jgi:RimJ/RimL family protein N-acetyltransferase
VTRENVAIREATEADADALQRFAERLFTESPPGIFRRSVPTLDEEREFIHGFDAENSVLLLAHADGEVVGNLGFEGRALPQEAHCGEFGLSVDRAWRERGVGTALINALIAWAPEHGVTRVEASVFATNVRALALYERLGFVREGRRRNAVITDGRAIDEIFLARLLPG